MYDLISTAAVAVVATLLVAHLYIEHIGRS